MTNEIARGSRATRFHAPALLRWARLAGAAVLTLLLFARLAAPSPVAAASCPGPGACGSGVQLFATSTTDGIPFPFCPGGQDPQNNQSGPGFMCTGTAIASNNCLTNGSFAAGLFACPGQPFVLPENGSLYPPAPPSWTYVPPAIAMASANTFPCDVLTPQNSNVAVNTGSCGGAPAQSVTLPENPVGTTTYSSFAPMTVASTSQPPAIQSGGSQNDLSQLISTSLSQFFGENPGILTSMGSGTAGAAPAGSSAGGASSPVSSAPTP
jgi:hypothetical protein